MARQDVPGPQRAGRMSTYGLSPEQMNHEELMLLLNRLLNVEEQRLQLDAAKTLEWCGRQVTDVSKIMAACNEVLDD